MDKAELIQQIIESLARCQRPAGYNLWKATGLSHAQIGMLFMLYHHRESNVKGLSEFLGVTKSAVTQLMEPLVEKRLVARQNDPKDRRVARLSLTSQGLKTLNKLNRLKHAGLRSSLDNLKTAELKRLAALSHKMAASNK